MQILAGLQWCGTVGELIALQELYLEGCKSLKELPNLQKLKNLCKLNIGDFYLINALPGFGDLTALEELNANVASIISSLDLRKLTKLQSLTVEWARTSEELQEIRNLVMLETLIIRDCWGLDELP